MEDWRSKSHHFQIFVARLSQRPAPNAYLAIERIISPQWRNRLRNYCSTESLSQAIYTHKTKPIIKRRFSTAPFSPAPSILRRIKMAIKTASNGKSTGEDWILSKAQQACLNLTANTLDTLSFEWRKIILSSSIKRLSTRWNEIPTHSTNLTLTKSRNKSLDSLVRSSYQFESLQFVFPLAWSVYTALVILTRAPLQSQCSLVVLYLNNAFLSVPRELVAKIFM